MPEELLDYSTAGVRAAGGSTDRTAAETPGSARLLDVELYLDNEFDLDKLLRFCREPPPAAPSHGRATGPVVNKAWSDRSLLIRCGRLSSGSGDGRQLLGDKFRSNVSVVGAAGGLAVIAVGCFIEKARTRSSPSQPLDRVLVLRLSAAAAAHRRRRRQLGHSHARRVDRGDGPRGVVPCLAENLGALPGAGCAILLFALGHINSLALGKETLLLFALQVFTGTSFTLLAFATGGLAAPIVAHCLYDWYTFYESHLAVTGQMEYSVEEGGRDDALKREFRFIDTNRDGKISPDELRIALFSFGIKTDDATAKATFAAADTDASGDVSFGTCTSVKNGDGDASAVLRGLSASRRARAPH